MVRSAPRYDPLIIELLHGLDDRAEPIAEICRRVAAEAERRGLMRPSPVHLRALLADVRAAVDAERSRKEELSAIKREVFLKWLLQQSTNAYEDALRIENSRHQRESD